MSETHSLSRLDLNLLVYLDLLLQERSVTLAARRAGITQSAMSRALQRLREHLKDELLVQVGRGMEPTEHGDALRVPLQDILSRIEREVLAKGEFDPTLAERRFRIAAPDFVQAVLLRAFIAECAEEAPGLTVLVSDGPSREGLEDGRFDLCVGPPLGGRGPIQSQKIFNDRWAALGRRGHPGIKKKKGLNLERFVFYTHISTADTPVDRALDELGRRRRVAVQVSSFLIGAEYAEASDHLLCAPQSLARALAVQRALTSAALPVVVPPITVSMSWHSRNQPDPAHRWLREQLAAQAARL